MPAQNARMPDSDSYFRKPQFDAEML